MAKKLKPKRGPIYDSSALLLVRLDHRAQIGTAIVGLALSDSRCVIPLAPGTYRISAKIELVEEPAKSPLELIVR